MCIHRQIDSIWFTHTVEYYSALKVKEIVSHGLYLSDTKSSDTSGHQRTHATHLRLLHCQIIATGSRSMIFQTWGTRKCGD